MSRQSHGGFTLLEVMIAMTVLALGSMAVAVTISSTDRADRETQKWTAAHRAAQEMLEGLLSEDFQAIVDLGGRRDSRYGYANAVFEVKSVAPRSLGYVEITDLGWEGTRASSYLVAVRFPVREDRSRFSFDVELSTVRTPY